MPFLITCLHCQARLRAAAALPVGRSLKCPKCSESFTIDEENQQEVSSSSENQPVAPAKRSAEKVEPKSKGRREEEERDDDYGEEDRPRKKSNSGGKGKKKLQSSSNLKLSLFIGGGIVVVLVIGIGIFFALREGEKKDFSTQANATQDGNKTSGEGKTSNGRKRDPNLPQEPAINPARPKRPLPKDLFAYYPGNEFSISYFDPRLNAELEGDEGFSRFLECDALGFEPDKIIHHIRFDSHLDENAKYALPYFIEALEVETDINLDELKNKRLYTIKTHPMGNIKIYEITWEFRGSPFYVIFPKPKQILVLHPNNSNPDFTEAKVKLEVAQDVLARVAKGNKIDDGFWSMIEEVSGYPRISADYDPPLFHEIKINRMAMGTLKKEKVEEYYVCEAHANEAEAEDQAMLVVNSAKLIQRAPKQRNTNRFRQPQSPPAPHAKRDSVVWVKGSLVYYFTTITSP